MTGSLKIQRIALSVQGITYCLIYLREEIRFKVGLIMTVLTMRLLHLGGLRVEGDELVA